MDWAEHQSQLAERQFVEMRTSSWAPHCPSPIHIRLSDHAPPPELGRVANELPFMYSVAFKLASTLEASAYHWFDITCAPLKA